MRLTTKTLLITIILSCFISACNNSPSSGGFGFISGPEGSDITLEYPDGDKENIGGTRIFGWDSGALLEGNYWRQLRIVTDEGALTFRMNFPEEIRPEESVISQRHDLRTSRLLLENSAGIDEVSVELFFQSSDEFDGLTNADGTVRIEQNINNDGETFDVTGEINATIMNEQGLTVKITGNFWKQDA